MSARILIESCPGMPRGIGSGTEWAWADEGRVRSGVIINERTLPGLRKQFSLNKTQEKVDVRGTRLDVYKVSTLREKNPVKKAGCKKINTCGIWNKYIDRLRNSFPNKSIFAGHHDKPGLPMKSAEINFFSVPMVQVPSNRMKSYTAYAGKKFIYNSDEVGCYIGEGVFVLLCRYSTNETSYILHFIQWAKEIYYQRPTSTPSDSSSAFPVWRNSWISGLVHDHYLVRAFPEEQTVSEDDLLSSLTSQKIDTQWNDLLRMESIKAIKIDKEGGQILIETQRLTCHMKIHGRRRIFDMGSFVISIKLPVRGNDGRFAIYTRRDSLFHQYSSEICQDDNVDMMESSVVAPHIFAPTNYCLGNAGYTIHSLLRTKNIYQLVYILIQFLSSANLNDPAGRNIQLWAYLHETKDQYSQRWPQTAERMGNQN